MNIANIFGLHFGCRIKFKQSSSDNYTGIGHLSAVKNGWVEISVEPDDTRLWYDCSDCKLLLKPLSAITDEDKAEFMEKFNTNSYYNYIDDRTPIDIWRAVKREIKIKEGFWLASKGYDIGIIPDEYKEVEE